MYIYNRFLVAYITDLFFCKTFDNSLRTGRISRQITASNKYLTWHYTPNNQSIIIIDVSALVFSTHFYKHEKGVGSLLAKATTLTKNKTKRKRVIYIVKYILNSRYLSIIV